MSARSYATTARDLALSLMVTPRKSPLVEAIDDAARECRNERRNASSMERFNDFADALDKLHEARALIVGWLPDDDGGPHEAPAPYVLTERQEAAEYHAEEYDLDRSMGREE